MRFWNFIVSCIAIPAGSTAFARMDAGLTSATPPDQPAATRPSHRARRLRRASRASRRVTG